MRFLLKAHGLAKTKRFYNGESPRSIFGEPIEKVEAAWLAFLDAHRVSSGMLYRIDLTGAQSPAQHTCVEGDSLRCSIEFRLTQQPRKTDNGNLVVAYTCAFRLNAEPETGADDSIDVKYLWRKDGIEIPGADGPILHLKNITPADSGTYVGIVGLRTDQSQPSPITARVLTVTVVPKSEVSPSAR